MDSRDFQHFLAVYFDGSVLLIKGGSETASYNFYKLYKNLYLYMEFNRKGLPFLWLHFILYRIAQKIHRRIRRKISRESRARDDS